VTNSFGLDYFLCSFIACVGVLQIATNSSKLTYLRLFGKAILGYFFGYSLLIFSAMLFFLSVERNIDDSSGGLDGNEQAILFVVSAFGSFLFTAIICSFRSKPRQENNIPEKISLSSLKSDTLIGVYLSQWTYWRKSILRYFK
tara:strand:+ start:1134 stop:1562 length:429 start_codon:yes stop_codon:yes gene_type:complete